MVRICLRGCSAGVYRIVNPAAGNLHVIADFHDGWPLFGLVGGEFASDRIDPEGEDLVETRRERLQRKQMLAKEIPVESLQVAQVENDPVTFRDRALVQRILTNNLKQAIRVRARIQQASTELRDFAETALGHHGHCPREIGFASGVFRCARAVFGQRETEVRSGQRTRDRSTGTWAAPESPVKERRRLEVWTIPSQRGKDNQRIAGLPRCDLRVMSEETEDAQVDKPVMQADVRFAESRKTVRGTNRDALNCP